MLPAISFSALCHLSLSLLDSLSSSDTDSEKPDSPVPINAPIYRMFGRERPIHMVLGGAADVLLWRDKKVTVGLLSAVTVIWLLFGFGGCRLITSLCRGSILFLILSFLWSNALNIAEKAVIEMKKHYQVFEAKFLRNT